MTDMKRIFFVVVLLFSVIFPLFSIGDIENTEIWFSPYPAGFNVNLEDTESYKGLNSSDPSSALMAVVGFGGLYDSSALEEFLGIITQLNSIKIDIQFETETWQYVSASEPYLKRPFGIDVVVNYGDFQGNSVESSESSYYGFSSQGGNVNLEDSFFSVTITLDKIIEWHETIFIPTGLNDVWVNFYLNLPDENYRGVDLSSALSANDYHARMKIQLVINGDVSNALSWTYTFNGYIDEEIENTSTTVFFSVLPSANANSMSVSQLADSGGVEIGSYSYESQAFIYDQTGSNDEYAGKNFHIFTSSSLDPNLNGGQFKLVNAGIESNPSEENVIYFQVGLRSTYKGNQSVTAPEQDTIWYGGTDTSSSITEDGLLRGAKRREVLSYDPGGWFGSPTYRYSLVFEDEGDILIRAAKENEASEIVDYQGTATFDNEFDASDYRSGVYTSTIYFHVVSDE